MLFALLAMSLVVRALEIVFLVNELTFPIAPPVSVNQVGYFTHGAKYGMVAIQPDRETVPNATWQLIEVSSGEVVASGDTDSPRFDSASGDLLLTANFSAFATPGVYRLRIDDRESLPFHIGDDLYTGLKRDALRYFYLNRSGIALEPRYAGTWARPAGHLSDTSVTCYRGTDAEGMTWDGCGYRLNAGGGWYDAGDFGKYVVNGGISVWTLLNLHEVQPDAFPDGTLNIPESGNGIPDLLDEARWEMEFLLGMQVPQNAPLAGMVHHKLHDLRWHPVPALPPERAGDERLLFPPSTAATLHVAAVGAQAARVWRDIDPAFAARCLAAAEAAWAAANANPTLYAGNTPGSGGGNYDDGNVSDEFYWAASELYLTTRNPVYRDVLTQSPHFTQFPGLDGSQVAPMSWQRTGALGTISLALHADALSPNEAATLQGQIIASADRYAEILAQEGYRLTLREHHYYWGSNSDVLNNALILSLAYRFTGEQRYLHIAAEGMDYLLGRNALRISFVSGYGSHSAQRMHHRFWANRPHEGYPPPPPGALAGGPNGSPSDPSAQRFRLAERAPAKRYIDRLESWSTNEVAINWNAPLVWVAAYLDANRPR